MLRRTGFNLALTIIAAKGHCLPLAQPTAQVGAKLPNRPPCVPLIRAFRVDRWLSGKSPGWLALLAKASAQIRALGWESDSVRRLAGCGGDSVLVELEQVVGRGHEPPLAAYRSAAPA